MEIEPINPFSTQRKHPVSYASLMVATLAPMMAGITVPGMFLKRLLPSPNAMQIIAGAGTFIVLTPLLMCVGAYCWLVWSLTEWSIALSRRRSLSAVISALSPG
jgi:hypothetical protein